MADPLLDAVLASRKQHDERASPISAPLAGNPRRRKRSRQSFTGPQGILRERQRLQDEMLNSIQERVLYSPVIGRSEGLLPVDDLKKLGLNIDPTVAGMAVGADPNSMSEEQRQYIMDKLGLSHL